MNSNAYQENRRREARQLLRIANRAVVTGEPRWGTCSAKVMAKIAKAQELRIARLEHRAPAPVEPTSIVCRLTPAAAGLLEDMRRQGEGKREGYSRAILALTDTDWIPAGIADRPSRESVIVRLTPAAVDALQARLREGETQRDGYSRIITGLADTEGFAWYTEAA